MWCLSPRAGASSGIENRGGRWARYSASWRSRKRVGSKKGSLLPDHVPMMIAIPPQYAVSQGVGFIKGKSAIRRARVYGERKRSFVGQHFWARGYWVSTVGRDEAVIRDYIGN
jgi:putative transposase